MVVPYFMVTASFFLRRNYPSLSKQYLIRYSKQYLTWSVLYLPFYLFYLNLQEIPYSTIPRTPSRTDLHRHQLPTLVHARFLSRSYPRPSFLEKWGWRITVCLACLLYLLGSVETYSSYLAESIFLTAFDSYKPSFHQPHLFYAPIFVLTGFYLADKLNHPIFQYRQNKLLVCTALLLLKPLSSISIRATTRTFYLA